jgi:hypothetical protein
MRTIKAILIVAAIICCSEPRKGNATPNEPILGGCITQYADGTCKLSAHPAYVAPLTAIDLKTSTLVYGIQALSAGLCYGVTAGPDKWWASGVSFCLNTAHTDQGNLVFPSVVGQVVNFASVGVGSICSDANSSAKNQLVCHAVLLFGLTLPIQ